MWDTTADDQPDSIVTRLYRRLCPHTSTSEAVDCLGGPGFGRDVCDRCGATVSHFTLAERDARSE